MGAAILAAALLGVGSLVSQAKLGVSNPLAAASAISQVVLLDADRAKAQDYPRVVLAKPDASLEEYMADEGYVEVEGERMGSIRVFATERGGDSVNYIEYTVNGLYSLWVWRE